MIKYDNAGIKEKLPPANAVSKREKEKARKKQSNLQRWLRKTE